MQLRDLDMMEAVALGLFISFLIVFVSVVIYFRTVG